MKGLRQLPALVLFVLGAWVSPAHGATYIVKPDSTGDFPTIQEALNAAATGDTVRVFPGYYTELLFWPATNGIVLQGCGLASTIVSAGGSKAVLLATSAVQDTTTVIRGIGFRNGYDAGIVLNGASPMIDSCAVDSTQNGPGIQCSNGSKAVIQRSIIRRNVGGIRVENGNAAMRIASTTIEDNTTTLDGGGIYLLNSPPTIIGNTIVRNRSQAGAGVFGQGAATTPTIAGNVIEKNAATIRGGGIYLLNAPGTITDNVIRGNTATYQGGGIAYESPGGTVTISGNTILTNIANEGGGVSGFGSSAIITENVVAENTATLRGGGIDLAFASGTLTGNTVTRNRSVGNGGGIGSKQSAFTISENTVTENVADGRGDGVATEGSTLPTIAASNIAFNTDYLFWRTNGEGLYHATSSSTPDARNTWWGHTTGPWHQTNMGGQGDTVSSFASMFSPWLADADTLAPPMPPIAVTARPLSCSQTEVSWNPVPLADLAGYRVYVDTDTSGPPYATVIDVGNVTAYTLPTPVCTTSYFIAVACYDREGNESWYSKEAVDRRGTAVPEPPGAEGVMTLSLGPASPNPFVTETVIDYEVPPGARTRLLVYDIQGRRVTMLLDHVAQGERESAVWNGRDQNGRRVAPGVYFLRLESDRGARSVKAILAR